MQLRHIYESVKDALDGSLKPFGGPDIETQYRSRLRASQLATVARHTPWLMAANVVNALIFLVAFFNSPMRGTAIFLAFCTIGMATYVYLRHRARQNIVPPVHASIRGIHKAIVHALTLGFLWAAICINFLPNSGHNGQIILVGLMIGNLCGAALTLASIPVAGIAVMAPMVLASVIAIAKINTMSYWILGGFLLVYSVVLFRAMTIYSAMFADRFLADLSNEQAALTDKLTGLPNRSAFDQRFDLMAARTERYKDGFAVCFIDLDRLKDVNDNFGHLGGDKFIAEAALRLKANIREEDFVARLGGDEFAIIAANTDDSTKVMAIAERLQNAFARPFQVGNVSIHGSATIGVAMIPSDGIEREEILRKADEALYNAKKDRRGSLQFFNPKNGKHALVQRDLLHDLQQAISNDELELVYQPIVDLDSNAVSGFEALLRWKHPTRGYVGPSEFIPLAEKGGLIHEIGEWVINHTIEEALSWPEHLRLAINVSAVQFRTVEIVDTIRNAVNRTGFDPARLELEITESVILADIDRADSMLQNLRKLGVRIALDDFGTGYSSLTYFIRLPLDKLKIDRSFMKPAPASVESAKLIKGIIGLADQLDLGVIAEGVETSAHMLFLKQFSGIEIQGYAISRPIPGAEIPDFLTFYRNSKSAAA